MPEIKILLLNVVNKIAASEVVERPASIVIEVVEYEFESLSNFVSNT